MLALYSTLLLSQGCETIADKLVGSEYEEITPFAQKTVEVLAVDHIQIRESELLHLRKRIKQSNTLITEMRPDYADYERVREELDRKELELRASLKVARVQITTWTLAHQALANGVKDPGEWLELSVKAAELLRDGF